MIHRTPQLIGSPFSREDITLERERRGRPQFQTFSDFLYIYFLTDSGKARGCSKNTIIIDEFLNSVTPQLCLRQRQSQTRRDNSKNYKTDYIEQENLDDTIASLVQRDNDFTRPGR